MDIVSGNNLTSKNFRINRLPSEGDVITASADIYRRNGWPQYNDQEDWKLGEAVGIIHAGQTVRINKIQTIESTQSDAGNIVWAKVVDASQ